MWRFLLVRCALSILGLFVAFTMRPPLVVLAPSRRPQPAPTPRPSRWFEDAKFGLFVHWGVYSLAGQGRVGHGARQDPDREYEKLPPRFNPTEFDADAWVKTGQGGRDEVHHHHEPSTTTASACSTAS